MSYRQREDVGTTPRGKRLTVTQVLAIFERHKGKCVLCGGKIHEGEPWRDEHLRALGLGGTNELDNRAPVHIACAKAKNAEDLPAIAQAKRKKAAAQGIKAPRKKIQSRGFAPTAKKSRELTKKLPPRRHLYGEE